MSSGAPKHFKLSIKKTSSLQQSHTSLNGASNAAAHGPRPKANAGGAGHAITPPAPPLGPPRPAGLSLKGASSTSATRPASSASAAPKSGFLKLKGQGQASAAATPSPAPHAAGPPSTGPKLGLGLKLKGQGSKPARKASPAAAQPSSIKQQAMAIAQSVKQETDSAVPAPRAASRPSPTPASAPRPASVANTPASARLSAATPATAPPARKFPGIKLKGASTPSSGARLPTRTPGSAPTTAGTAAAPAAKPRITLNRTRGVGSVNRPPSFPTTPASRYSYQPQQDYSQDYKPDYKQDYSYQPSQQDYSNYQAPKQEYKQDYKPPSPYKPPAATTSAGGYGNSAMPMDRHAALADAAALAASTGADIEAVPASTPAYGDYSYADYGSSYAAAPAPYRPVTGHKRGRPPGSGRPRDATGLGSAAYQPPLAPRSKKPKIGAFRDKDKDTSEDEDFNPKAERLNARRAAAAAAARHRPAAAVHRPGFNRAAAAGHRAASNRARAAVAAAAARHAHAAATAAAVVPPRPQPPPAPAAPAAPAADHGDLPMTMSAADAAAAFARMTSTADGAAAFGLSSLDKEASEAAAAAVPAAPAPPAHPSAPAAVAAHMRGGPAAAATAAAPAPARSKGPLVDPQLLYEVNSAEETNPPMRDTMMKLLHAVDKKDKFRFFVQPVTDSVAPGYSKVIQHPMDLSTMKSKLDKGKYNAWADIQSDLVLMCTNAKTYNHAGTVVYKQADLLLTYSLKMVKNFKQGKMKVRGFSGNVPNAPLPGVPAPPAAAAAGNAAAPATAATGAAAAGASAPATRSEKRERSEAPPVPSGPMVTRQTRRGNKRRGDEAPVQKKIRGSRFIAINQNTDTNNAAGDGNDHRDTFRGLPKFPAIAAWRGLADGANPEGVPYGVNGKPVLRCVAGHINNLPPESYLRSLTRFVSGAGAAAEKLVTQLFGTNLQLLVPIKGVIPQQQQQQRAPQQQAPLPHQLQQMQQQQQAQLRLPVGGSGGVPGVQIQQQQQHATAAVAGHMAVPQNRANAAGQHIYAAAAQQPQQQQQPQQFVPGPHTAHYFAGGPAAGLPGMQGLVGMQGISMPVGMGQQL